MQSPFNVYCTVGVQCTCCSEAAKDLFSTSVAELRRKVRKKKKKLNLFAQHFCDISDIKRDFESIAKGINS